MSTKMMLRRNHIKL